MMPAAKNFNFESFMVEQITSINKKLDGLNSAYVPREEIMLMAQSRDAAINAISKTVEAHTTLLSTLKSTDDNQQGRIDAQRFWLTLLGAFSAATVTAMGYLITHHT